MPVNIEYAKDGFGVYLIHEGIVTGEELLNAISKTLSDFRFKRLKYWIGDRTGCTEFFPDVDHFKKAAELMGKASAGNPGLLVALVSPKDIEFGMSRMYQVFEEDSLFITEIFRDRDSAEKWIKNELKKRDSG